MFFTDTNFIFANNDRITTGIDNVFCLLFITFAGLGAEAV